MWVRSCELRFYENKFTSCEFLLNGLKSNFTSWKCILQVGNKTTSWKLLFATCELHFTSVNFKEIILRVAFYKLKILKFYFTSCEFLLTSWKFKMITLRVESLRWYCLRLAKLFFTSWTFRMPLLRLPSHVWIKFQENKSS